MKTEPIPTAILPSITRAELSPRATEAEFRALIRDGARWQVAGKAARNPGRLLSSGHSPKHRLDLFGNRFYLANVRQNPELRFIVAYVVPGAAAPRSSKAPLSIFPRIFYKDLSLVWRSASHYSNGDGLWIGKGDIETIREGEDELITSRESTTDLPIEMQSALEGLLRWVRRPREDQKIIGQVLREASPDRIAPFADFTRPRKKAASNPANLIHGGKRIARFTRKNDPTSLEITRGFEPDFAKGILETSVSKSRLYGGKLERFRILSTNRKIQYGFLAGPKHVWIMPPQATTTELSSYGVRTIDVLADDDLFIPGYEYHYYEDVDETESGEPELYSQIPEGFAGEPCEQDDAKADASPWLDEIPVIQEFRKKVLRKRR